MFVFHDEFQLKTSRRIQIIDITEKVENSVKKSKIKNGICLIFVPHATAAIILNEAENGLMDDIEKFIQKLFPQNANYRHNEIDNNADSHIASGIVGQSQIYPVKNGRILRGMWQRALFLELDGPRERKVNITIIGK